MCLFSIIVPVFNTKVEYLQKCIHSIKSQLTNNYELIIVNDGSTETSTNNFLKKLSFSENIHIKVISQENKGVSTARNLGIKKSVGDYILFLDADDYLNFNCLENLSSVIKDGKYDILFFKYKIYRSNTGNLLESKDNFVVEDLPSNEIILKEILNPKEIHENVNYGTPWGKVIKKSLILENNILYETDLPRTQDRVFMFDCCKKAKKMGLYDYSGYIYNSNPESVCSKYNKDLFEKLMRVYNKFIPRVACVNYDLSSDFKQLKINFYFETLSADIFHKDNKKSLFKKIKEANHIYLCEYKELFKENLALNNPIGKRRICIYLFKYHLRYVVYAMYFFNGLLKR